MDKEQNTVYINVELDTSEAEKKIAALVEKLKEANDLFEKPAGRCVKDDHEDEIGRAGKRHVELIEELTNTEYKVLVQEMMVRYRTKWPDDYKYAEKYAETWKWNGK